MQYHVTSDEGHVTLQLFDIRCMLAGRLDVDTRVERRMERRVSVAASLTILALYSLFLATSALKIQVSVR